MGVRPALASPAPAVQVFVYGRGNLRYNSPEKIAAGWEEQSMVYYHLPGLFEFYEFYRVFLPLFRTHREYFTTGVTSAPFMAHRRTACGAADVWALARLTPAGCWN